MYLVADSGSTKADWVLVKDNKASGEFFTKGFNPFFHDENFILSELHENLQLKQIADQVDTVNFYGAGCSSKARKEVIVESFRSFFTKAKINVRHDLQAAIHATSENKPCFIGILGTGSNAAYFDGENINQKKPALGYILGDEGSGAFYGKQLLQLYLYGNLPPHLSKKLEVEYQVTKERILVNVYRNKFPNVYLASFAKFLSDNRYDDFVRQMISAGMSTYLETHICCYENYNQYPTHFIGSIAHYFQDVLKEVASGKGITIGKIIQRPVTGLVEYYLKK